MVFLLSQLFFEPIAIHFFFNPAMRQVRNDPDQISRSENHHPAVIDKALFDRVQEMKRIRTNVEVDEKGNKIRKNTHYSMKRPVELMEAPTE